MPKKKTDEILQQTPDAGRRQAVEIAMQQI